jgi:hypothetical protein
MAAFVAAPSYFYGNSGRDILTGPGAVNFDFSVFKRFPMKKLLGEQGEITTRNSASPTPSSASRKRDYVPREQHAGDPVRIDDSRLTAENDCLHGPVTPLSDLCRP